jgi:hypothetical protein
MNLGEQLDELRGNILRDTSDIIAGESDRLWTDETLLRYIGEGERRFTRETLILRDGNTPEFCRITLKVGVRDYPLHEQVIALVSARAATQPTDLYRGGHALVQPPKVREVINFETISNDTSTAGPPIAIYTDETLVYASQNRVTASIYPVPDTASDGLVVNMRVVRLPRDCYSLDDLERPSELPRDYQLDVLQWAAYRAKANHDGDAGSATSAGTHEEAFEKAVARAIRETKRKVLVGTGLNYGTNGFSWVR